MAFWENMKIWQMGQLLQNRARPDVQNMWGRWQDRILDVRSSLMSNATHLSGLPKAPAAYFLAFVAVLCEKEQEVPHLEMDEIGASYLSGILDKGRDWKQTIALFLPCRDPSPQECWDRILHYTEDFMDNGFHTNTELRELLDRIQKVNQQASLSGEWEEQEAIEEDRDIEERKIPQESMDHLIRIMNAFDEAWQHLTGRYAAPTPTIKTLCSLIENGVRQIILTGAPGTGKTYAAMETVRLLGADSEIHMAQFHPSYDYTDFVEGLRPVQLEGETKSTFVRLDGSFKAFCRHVAEENKNRQSTPEDTHWEPLYFFLIDEINRANLSQVFGELMFCLESDKRDKPVQTQYRNLPTYQIGEDHKASPLEDDIFSHGFFIPKNVVIIGTMNDIDRSVESMDFALRRRFIWHEVRVEKDLLKAAFESGNFGVILQENAEEAAQLVSRLNTIIENSASLGLNRHYDISQGQFSLPVPEADTLNALMLFVWKYRIEPLLQEYVRGEAQEEADAFIQKCAQALELADKGNAGSKAEHPAS